MAKDKENKEEKLEDLLEKIDEESLHEIQFPNDKPKGNEIW